MIRNKNKRGIVITVICFIIMIVCLILAYYNKDANPTDYKGTKDAFMVFCFTLIGVGVFHPVVEILGWILLLLCTFLE